MKLLSSALLLLSLTRSLSLAFGKSPRPLVLWHGLGDSHSSPGMLDFAARIKEIHPGIFIHSIFIEEDLGKDRQSGFYGNVNEQIEFVAVQLAAVPELSGGFDAIGFSQGGQFLRAYVERFNSPPIRNLITFGSQHMGISDIPGCSRYDFICQAARRAAKAAIYSDWAQQNIIQAQYYRDPAQYEVYIEANKFLTSINNEIEDHRNSTYRRNLAFLEKLVLVIFSEDKTVVPKESSWFGAEEFDDDSFSKPQAAWKGLQARSLSRNIIPMRLQPLYLEDWIGLRQLDKRDAIVFETCEGEHMQIGDCWEDLVIKFAGSSTN